MVDVEITPNGYTDSFGPNVSRILCQGTLVVTGKIPSSVRRELSVAVKAGVLGRLRKDGLKPEVYYHPNHKNGAQERQQREALYSISCIEKVIASPSHVRDGMEKMGIDVINHILGKDRGE